MTDDTDDNATDDQLPVTWIRSEPSADGKTYVVTMESDPDHAIVLDRDTATAYAQYVFDAVERAAYDAAVRRQVVQKMGLGDQEAAQLVIDMRQERPEQEHVWPTKIFPSVAARDGRPFLRLELPDGTQGQWEVDAATEHAVAVMGASIVADLDAGYYRILTGSVGVEEPIARNVIDDLRTHRFPGL